MSLHVESVVDKNSILSVQKRSKYQLNEETEKKFFMIILISFILNSFNLYLIPYFIPIMKYRGESDLCAICTFSAEMSYKYTVAPNEPCRPNNFVICL